MATEKLARIASIGFTRDYMRVPYAIGSVNISQSPIDPKAWHILVGVPEELGRQGLPEIYRKVPVRYVALGSSRSFE